jgi:hypothetical protein
MSRNEVALFRHAVARLRASVMAITFGLTAGTGLFVVTAWLILSGGEPMGPHLGLLSHYFPGYSVSWPGAFLGAIYGFASGALIGWSIARIYNWYASAEVARTREP